MWKKKQLLNLLVIQCSTSCADFVIGIGIGCRKVLQNFCTKELLGAGSDKHTDCSSPPRTATSAKYAIVSSSKTDTL